jgi:hypothetical protein
MAFFLVDLLSVEGDTEGAEQQSAISVVCSGSVDSNVEARDHLRRIPISLSQYLPSLIASATTKKTYMS